MDVRQGDALELLRGIEAESVQTCVTSPPYFGLRDYGVPGQLGLERTPDEYVSRMAEVFREVRRVLREDGTLWLNLGDSYASDVKGSGGSNPATSPKQAWKGRENGQAFSARRIQHGLKPKDLVGIPWRVAFALQADGWWLRSDIIWHKPNPMPESVADRPTKAHEYVFLFAKSESYFYDATAIAEPVSWAGQNRYADPSAHRYHAGGLGPELPRHKGLHAPGPNRVKRSGNIARKPGSARGCPEDSGSNVCGSVPWEGSTRNRRSVWTITTQPFGEAHFAVMPQALVEPCVLAGSRPGDLVLDPFGGSGTVGVVSLRHGRRFLGLELNPAYVEMARKRIAGPLFACAPPV